MTCQEEYDAHRSFCRRNPPYCSRCQQLRARMAGPVLNLERLPERGDLIEVPVALPWLLEQQWLLCRVTAPARVGPGDDCPGIFNYQLEGNAELSGATFAVDAGSHATGYGISWRWAREITVYDEMGGPVLVPADQAPAAEEDV